MVHTNTPSFSEKEAEPDAIFKKTDTDLGWKSKTTQEGKLDQSA